jgi:periplasmic protein TonB
VETVLAARRSVPGPLPVRSRRPPAEAAAFGRGFGVGLAASLGLHAAAGAAFLWFAFGPGGAEPRVLSLETSLAATVDLEPEPPPREVPPPEAETPPPEETLLEVVEVPSDPRADPAPKGEEAPVIGITDPGLPGRPLPRLPVGSPRGAESGKGTGPAVRTADTQAPPRRVPVFASALPRRESCSAPAYPDAERDRGVEGTLRLRLVVGPDGTVRSVDVADTSGSRALDAAAVEAVRGWLFDPATEDGVPVESTVLLPVTFRIRRAR